MVLTSGRDGRTDHLPDVIAAVSDKVRDDSSEFSAITIGWFSRECKNRRYRGAVTPFDFAQGRFRPRNSRPRNNTALHSGASSHRTVRSSWLLFRASKTARIVRSAWSGVTSNGAPFSMASRTFS